jgi:hypothetical protein
MTTPNEYHGQLAEVVAAPFSVARTSRRSRLRLAPGRPGLDLPTIIGGTRHRTADSGHVTARAGLSAQGWRLAQTRWPSQRTTGSPADSLDTVGGEEEQKACLAGAVWRPYCVGGA